MAFSLSQFPTSSATKPINYRKFSTTSKSTLNQISNFTRTRVKFWNNNHRFAVIRNAVEEQQKPTTVESETPSDEELSELGAVIKKVMMDKEVVKKDESIWAEVMKEIGRIEWSAFNKVLGTPGVVLGVIVGSSVILLTVNAVLAELSDRVFASRNEEDEVGCGQS